METNVLGIVIVILVVIIIALLFWHLGRQEPDQPEPERPAPTKEYYFSPDEVVFKIRHSAPPPSPAGEETPDAEVIKADIVTAIGGFLNTGGRSSQLASANVAQPAAIGWREMLEMPQGATSNVVTLQFTKDSPAFSLVRVPVKEKYLERDSDQAVRDILKGAYVDLTQNNLETLENGSTIEDFSLNWLFSGLHHGGATGGPGGLPTEAPPPAGGVQSFRVISPTASLTDVTKTVTIDGPKTTYVAILDSAPTGDAIAKAYHDKWPHHSGLERLFGKNFTGGKLTVHYASPATLYDMEHFSPLLHTYLMPDHGTFIAGIINSGAPDADLHLYQVLSRYGVGTFTSIAQGISDAMDQLGRPLIINCSFQFCLPSGDFGAQLEADLGVPMAALHQSMQELFEVDIINDPNIKVVASAGNDSTNKPRVDARFPAAFHNVIGVGALPDGNPTSNNIYTPASYSNFADHPHGTGFMTLGGEPGAGRGIRGVYVSDFPGSANNTGWAWWAGTSFAAAIITGWLAGELSSNNGFLPPTTTPQPGQTPDGEAVILIQQP